MAKIKGNPKVSLTVTLELEEDEARALEALTGYGTQAFLSFFYEKLGTHYLKPHEAGLIRLFETVSTILPPVLNRAQNARETFKAQG